MTNITQVLQTPTFKKAVNKLHKNQKTDLDNAVKELIKEPLLGEQKKGDLSFLRVHKFKMVKQLMLLGYSYEDGTVTLELMALGSHENFYRDIKNIFLCTNTNGGT
ncbi:type II toxin-antitoxin system RelE/ParE family toxin [Photobacterium phosphoreum]|uniref:Type II toxin-antitoxin system RelE/ParE family toxin n=1 Tax=Photobacterium phosphoreum TaxID=659 RepID=A0AAW4ZWN6_PHOPO|nr:type II toxin-antitoxin system RelE/ParE family toxin [Photobacterium phosphoreum]MCD9491393.1 type II toxin-antitoxin system RelE/ParE family toxin [Photobacterium phosphoreum]MCF2190771.1 type II toxin-antitoxin system RelE/ParE family toxin [Photobacterium phosphoreum]MCF2302302.1 type II toxin-antitoxin system RelE/ParE family toxin [Photobacterium phosphoreum]